MKCSYCSGDLSIENAFCPHCGKPNPLYGAHREDMANYEKQFEKTKEKTIEKNERDTRKAVRVTIVAVLSALILASIIVLTAMDDITDAMEKAENRRNISTIVSTLQKMEAEQDYINFDIYFDSVYYGIYNTEVSEFIEAATVADQYHLLIDRTASLVTGEYYGDTTDLAKGFNMLFETMFDVMEQGEKNPSSKKYSPEHMEAINNIIYDSCIIVEKYLGIPREVVLESESYTETERQILFEKYIEKVIADE